MATSVTTGTFTLRGTAGSQVITGLGFQPKLVIFWGHEVLQVAGGLGVMANELRRTFGAATSSTARWTSCFSIRIGDDDGHDQQFLSTKCIQWNDAASDVPIISANLTSMDAGGFTINVSSAKAVSINYMAIGGTSVSAAVGHFNGTTTPNSSQAITGVGFLPKALIVQRGPADTSEGVVGECHNMIGIATSTSARGVSGVYMQGASPPPVKSFQKLTHLLAMNDSNDAFNVLADLGSFDSDGFTIAWNLAYTPAAEYGYIALGGAAPYKMFSVTQPTTVGSQSTTGLGFTPLAELFVAGGFSANPTTVNSGWYDAIGAAVSTSARVAHGSYVPDGSTSVNQPVIFDGTGAACYSTSNSSGTVNDRALFVSHDADGFTLNWDAVSGVAAQILGLAIGGAATTTLLLGVAATGSVGAVTVKANAGVTATGVAGTGSVGTATGVARPGITLNGLVATGAVGSVTVTGQAAVVVTGVSAAGNTGDTRAGVMLGTAVSGVVGTMGAIVNPPVETPTFNFVPNFTPDHVNTASDPSQPTRWTNVYPP